MNKLITFFDKPEYFYRPSNLLRRIKFKFLSRHASIQVIPLCFGYKILSKPKQTIGRSLYTFGLYDLALSECILRIVQEGDSVIDVGANIGYTSLLMQKCLNKKGILYNFEPIPELYEQLQKNLKLNDSGPITITSKQLALSDQSLETTITLPESFGQNDGIATLEKNAIGKKIKIQTKKLDELNIQESVRLMKIDVEGHELSVLKGATNMLKQNQIEFILYEDLNGYKGGTSEYLESLGYHVYKLVKNFRGLTLESPQTKTYNLFEPENFIATKNTNKIKEINQNIKWKIFK